MRIILDARKSDGTFRSNAPKVEVEFNTDTQVWEIDIQ